MKNDAERGSMAVGIVMLVVAVTLLAALASVMAAQSQHDQVRAAAGIAALQAADAQRGLIADVPCARAERVAAAHAATAASCGETERGMLVTLTRDSLLGRVTATAHAGRSEKDHARGGSGA
ncbi:hypothetical protein [Pseudoclavibacter sp. 13-3]|uniref:hypothetical protein n=1 Tax=Pseudoclavibacter sp. 13-3 TaxID=2901228 RepID=UPI001E5EA69C|nr:hypothetical protein [Pseudoclavibacter sp. 13-3]MCD7101726.1 hypothetical protein [Pseudoclavibacter sp. 13-3]